MADSKHKLQLSSGQGGTQADIIGLTKNTEDYMYHAEAGIDISGFSFPFTSEGRQWANEEFLLISKYFS